MVDIYLFYINMLFKYILLLYSFYLLEDSQMVERPIHQIHLDSQIAELFRNNEPTFHYMYLT